MDPKLDRALKLAEAQIQRTLLILNETIRLDHLHEIDAVTVDTRNYANLGVEVKVRKLP